MADFAPISLTDPQSCQAELERCSNGLAYMDHLYSQVLDALDEAEATWEAVEAEAAAAARTDAPKAATATEIRGLIHEWVSQRPSKAEAREKAREARRRKDKLDRFMRSLEKRLSAAQSAAKGHESLGRYGGGEK